MKGHNAQPLTRIHASVVARASDVGPASLVWVQQTYVRLSNGNEQQRCREQARGDGGGKHDGGRIKCGVGSGEGSLKWGGRGREEGGLMLWADRSQSCGARVGYIGGVRCVC